MTKKFFVYTLFTSLILLGIALLNSMLFAWGGFLCLSGFVIILPLWRLSLFPACLYLFFCEFFKNIPFRENISGELLFIGLLFLMAKWLYRSKINLIFWGFTLNGLLLLSFILRHGYYSCEALIFSLLSQFIGLKLLYYGIDRKNLSLI